MTKLAKLSIMCGISLLGFIQYLDAQDLHVTNYTFAPEYINPAKTGKFYGSYRIGGVYREQFGSFIQKAYKSPMLFVDVPFTFAFAKNHWTSLGIAVYRDWAGDISLENTGMITSGAYHIGLDKKMSKVVSIGIQFATINRTSGKPENAKFGEQIRQGSTKDVDLLNGFKGNYQDYNAGLMFSAKTDRDHIYELGVSMYHIANPSFAFNGSTVQSKIGNRINAHGKYRFPVTPIIALEPGFVYSTSNQVSNTNIQLQAYYSIRKADSDNPKKSETTGILNAGLGYRLKDAIELMLGYQFKNWQIGLAYDYTVSSAASYNRSYGGFEVGVIYTGIVHKKVNVKPKVFCPRF